MKYYIIAGEASGDLHASNLIKGITRHDPRAQCRGWGGDLMQAAGCTIVRHYKDTAIMGFLTVLRHLGTIRRNLRQCHDDILRWRPDALILVDYSGFNLRLASTLQGSGIKILYYISPKIWAWNTRRVRTIKRLVHQMYVIFPFEVDFYARHGLKAKYAGNPLVDAIDGRDHKHETFQQFIQANHLDDKPIIALLPGSRSQELKHVLPKMLAVQRHFPQYQFVIAGAPSMTEADYAPLLRGHHAPVIFGETYRLLQQSQAALVTSGTATLETALLRIPQVVCYSGEGGALSYLLFKLFVKVKYISLVNLIAGREIIPELLMQRLNERNILRNLRSMLPGGTRRQATLMAYEEVIHRLGDAGASDRFATMIVSDLLLTPTPDTP